MDITLQISYQKVITTLSTARNTQWRNANTMLVQCLGHMGNSVVIEVAVQDMKNCFTCLCNSVETVQPGDQTTDPDIVLS